MTIVIRREGVNAHFEKHIFHVCDYDTLKVIDSFSSENDAIEFCFKLGYNSENISRYY